MLVPNTAYFVGNIITVHISGYLITQQLFVVILHFKFYHGSKHAFNLYFLYLYADTAVQPGAGWSHRPRPVCFI